MTTVQLALLVVIFATARAQLSQFPVIQQQDYQAAGHQSQQQSQISSFPIYGAPMYQQQQSNKKLSFDTLQANDPEYEPAFYRTRNRYFLRDKKKQETAQRELEEREPLANHRRKSAPMDTAQIDERASRCYAAMSVEPNKIIDSTASVKNGAEYLSTEKISILSSQFSLKEVQQRCMQRCCDSADCDSSLLSLKMGQDGYRCYLFKCNDRCIYIKHSDYVVLRSRTPEQLDQTSKINDKPMTNQEALNNFGMNAGAMYSGGGSGWSNTDDTDSTLRAMKTSLVRPEDKIYFDPTSRKSSTGSVSLAIILLVLGMGMVVGFFAYLIGNTRFVKNRLSQQLNRMRMRQHQGQDKNLEVDGDYLINGMYL